MVLQFLLFACLVATQSSDTLPAMARQQGGQLALRIDVNSPSADLTHVLEESAFVVKAIVNTSTTELSQDQMDVLTVYRIRPLDIYKRTDGKAVYPTEIVVQRPGGSVVVDKRRISVDVSDYPPSAELEPGETIVAFLTPSRWKSDAYTFTEGACGLLRVDNASGQVKQIESIAPRRPGMPDNVQDLEALLRMKTRR